MVPYFTTVAHLPCDAQRSCPVNLQRRPLCRRRRPGHEDGFGGATFLRVHPVDLRPPSGTASRRAYLLFPVSRLRRVQGLGYLVLDGFTDSKLR